MAIQFVDLARRGENGWWRWLLGLTSLIVIWLGIGFVLTMVIVAWVMMDSDPGTYVDIASNSLKGLDPIISYVALNLGHVAMIAALFIVMRRIHRRPFLSIVTCKDRVSWERVGLSFALWFGLCAATMLVDYILYPSTYRLSFNLSRFFVFLPFILVLTPLQTTAEELFFRGYLMQGLGLWTRNPLALSVMVGLLFMGPHLLNPEMAAGFVLMAIYYFCMGFFLALVTLKSNSLEYALGIHAATCLFFALVCNYEHSVMETESVFFCSVLNPLNSLIYFAIICAVFFVVMFGFDWRVNTSKPEPDNLHEPFPKDMPLDPGTDR